MYTINILECKFSRKISPVTRGCDYISQLVSWQTEVGYLGMIWIPCITKKISLWRMWGHSGRIHFEYSNNNRKKNRKKKERVTSGWIYDKVSQNEQTKVSEMSTRPGICNIQERTRSWFLTTVISLYVISTLRHLSYGLTSSLRPSKCLRWTCTGTTAA